ncbi:hypothetical protein ABW19_dt0205221 [Dactylella cylindrospora]|nr:hypothetical protein ABW19_dt0205221 [Dactylella cylindrospora]
MPKFSAIVGIVSKEAENTVDLEEEEFSTDSNSDSSGNGQPGGSSGKPGRKRRKITVDDELQNQVETIKEKVNALFPTKDIDEMPWDELKALVEDLYNNNKNFSGGRLSIKAATEEAFSRSLEVYVSNTEEATSTEIQLWPLV